MMAETPEWDPHAQLYDVNEKAMTDEEGYLKQASCRRTIM
jgi:hypothetical protein